MTLEKNINMKNVETEFASRLLEVQAVKVQPDAPFTWASGWKSPFYCDNRKTLSYPELRTFVKDNLVVLVKEFFAEADAVAGVDADLHFLLPPDFSNCVPK